MVDALVQLLTISADEEVHRDQQVAFVPVQFQDLI